MDTAIGRELSAKEVEALKDGTNIWIETNIPSRNVFLGIKEGNGILNYEGKARKFSVIDVGFLCIAKEWLYKEPPKIEAVSKEYVLKQNSVIEDEEEKIVILKGTKVSSQYSIDENDGLRVKIRDGEYKGREFIFSMIELNEIA